MIYLIGTGAAIGSLLRFELTNLIKAKFGANWPLATLIINLIGAFCLGWLFGETATYPVVALFGHGDCRRFYYLFDVECRTRRIIQSSPYASRNDLFWAELSGRIYLITAGLLAR